MITGSLKYLVPGAADRDAGLLPIGDSARQRDGIGLPEEYSYVRNSSAPPMFVNDVGGRAQCAAAFSQRAHQPRAGGWVTSEHCWNALFGARSLNLGGLEVWSRQKMHLRNTLLNRAGGKCVLHGGHAAYKKKESEKIEMGRSLRTSVHGRLRNAGA
jgi:hypothetical protein